MESRSERGLRLIGWLERLVRQEARLVSKGDFSGVLEVQRRIGGLIEGLSRVAAEAGEPDRERVAAICERRRRSAETLESVRARVGEELRQLRANQRRLAQLGPAYGRPPPMIRQLSATG